jgi:hypothetical protein
MIRLENPPLSKISINLVAAAINTNDNKQTMYAQGGYGQAPPQQYNAGYQQQQQYAPQQQQQQMQQQQYGVSAQQQMTEQPQQAQQTQQQVVTQAAPTDQSKAQPIYVDTQHDDMVHDAQLDYYGTKLATSSSGK